MHWHSRHLQQPLSRCQQLSGHYRRPSYAATSSCPRILFILTLITGWPVFVFFRKLAFCCFLLCVARCRCASRSLASRTASSRAAR